MLFATTKWNSNVAPVTSTSPTPSGGWSVNVFVDSSNGYISSGSPTSIVYVPYSTPNLIGGHINALGATVQAAGNFSANRTNTGTYEIAIPGVTSADDGVLILTAFEAGGDGGGAKDADDNSCSYIFDDAHRHVPGLCQRSRAKLPGERRLRLCLHPFENNFATPATYPGSCEDLVLWTGVNGEMNAVDQTVVSIGDLVQMHLRSPAGTFDGSIDFVFGQLFTTGIPPIGPMVYPSVRLDPTQSVVSLNPIDALVGSTPLSSSGATIAFIWPVSLTGQSLMIQGIVLDGQANNGVLAASNGHELILN